MNANAIFFFVNFMHDENAKNNAQAVIITYNAKTTAAAETITFAKKKHSNKKEEYCNY